jgi:Skp family chaperone for outer membrane proteins
MASARILADRDKRQTGPNKTAKMFSQNNNQSLFQQPPKRGANISAA